MKLPVLAIIAVVAVVVLALFLVPIASAQSNGFAGASDAVAIHFNGEWSAGTHITQSFDFLDFGASKNNHLYLEGHQLLAPGPGFNAYAGGLKIEPDLSKLIKKTNVQPGAFGLSFSASVGNGVPSVGGSHISEIFGVGAKYNLTNSLTWKSLEVDYARFGTTNYQVISTGLAFAFTK